MKIKKIASVFLALTLITSSFGYVSANDAHWAKESIDRMTSLGIVQGNDKGDFLPDNFITRAELFTILNRLTKVSAVSGNSFPDVADDAWYKNQVDIAVTDGYVTGYQDSTIKPENYITRQETAVIISRLFGAKEYDDSAFSDNDKIASWAKDGINQATKLGLISGYEDNSFKPDANIKRAEVVAILDKLVGKIETSAITLKDETIEKNLIITAGNVLLDNVTVNGNVYITNAASNDEVRFLNSKINGSIFYGNKNDKAVVLENTACDSLVVGGNNAQAVITGSTDVKNIYIDGASSIISPDFTGEAVENIYVSGDVKIDINAKNVSVLKKAIVEILENANVESLSIEKDATGADISTIGKLNNITNNASNAKLNGNTITQGYESNNIVDTTQKYSFSYPTSSSKGSSGGKGGSSGGNSGGSSGGSSSSSSGSTGSSSTPSKPSSGAASNENKAYEIENIILEDGFEFEEDFDKEVLDYKVIVDFDVESIKLGAKFTAGATVTINGKEVLSETPIEISDIEYGESEVEIVIMDGIRTLKTYTVTINKGYAAPEGTIEALNALFRETVDAEADAQDILNAFGDAKIDGAIILLTAQYKTEYDIMAQDGDLTQRQFMSLISKVNEEGSDILETALGIKDEDGFVYTQNITMTQSGMFNVSVRYASTNTADDQKLAIYIDGVKYESEAIRLDSSKGWVETNVKVPLNVGENELSMYAETKKDGNFGIIVRELTQTGDKLETSVFKLEAEDAEYSTTKAAPYGGNAIEAGYKQKKSSVTGTPTLVGGGNVVFRFNSPADQTATLRIIYYMGAPSGDWRLAFFNPVATPSSYNLEMVEGVDYPALSEAVMSDTSWTSNTKQYIFETTVSAKKGENVVWIPGRNLFCINADNNGTADMYLNGTKRPNHQTQVDFIEVVPNDFDVTAIQK